MRTLGVGIGILAICLALCLGTTFLLDRYTEQAAAQLEQAKLFGEAGEYEEAVRWVDLAISDWEARKGFFGMALRHDELDRVVQTLQELHVYAEDGCAEEFGPTCAGLIEQIRHISDMEKPYFYNVL